MKSKVCQDCGLDIKLIRFGNNNFKWVANVRNKTSWHCGDDPAFPVKSHRPGVATMNTPGMKEIDIRVSVPADTDERKLIHGILMETEGMYDIVQLKNNGFGHLLPDEDSRITYENLAG
jgi:hypothetical protein